MGPTKHRRALSLVEVLVVAAIFAGMMTSFALIQIAVSKQGKRTTKETDVQDALTMTMEAVKRDLRGARLTQWLATSLSYRTPLVDDQSRLIPGSTGMIQFTPPTPDRYLLQMDSSDGWLKRYGPGAVGAVPPRRMGRLGSGNLTIALVSPKSTALLRLTFVCRLADLQRQGEMKVYFSNQL